MKPVNSESWEKLSLGTRVLYRSIEYNYASGTAHVEVLHCDVVAKGIAEPHRVVRADEPNLGPPGTVIKESRREIVIRFIETGKFAIFDFDHNGHEFFYPDS